MGWLGSTVIQLAAVVFGVVAVGLGGYGYYRSRISRSELVFMLVAAAAVFAYAIEDAATVLSRSSFVSSLLAGAAGLSFVGLFLYWADSQDGEAGG